jgi:hypothetical protein
LIRKPRSIYPEQLGWSPVLHNEDFVDFMLGVGCPETGQLVSLDRTIYYEIVNGGRELAREQLKRGLTAFGAIAFVMGLILWLNRFRISAKLTNFGDFAIRLHALKVFGMGGLILGALCFFGIFLLRLRGRK